jgi:tRNA-dihydrouridine synthase B
MGSIIKSNVPNERECLMKPNGIFLQNRIMLAPMAGVTDSIFRRICFDFGCEMAVTEMISAKAVCFGDDKTFSLARIDKNEKMTALQIFGHEEDVMAEAAIRLLEHAERDSQAKLPCAVDINMGCPVKKIVSNKEGSALMRDPELVYRIVKSVAEAVGIPVSVKIRSGYSKDETNACEVAMAAESGGACMIGVHGRTREQMYSGKADYEIIGKVKKSVSVPVFGSGDIYSADDAKTMLDVSGCDGVMAARGAMGNPWIFAELSSLLFGTEYRAPSVREKIDVALRHAETAVREYGETRAIREMRKQIAWYLSGVRGAATARNAVNFANSLDEVKQILNQLI